jgi:hypothetical protein
MGGSLDCEIIVVRGILGCGVGAGNLPAGEWRTGGNERTGSIQATGPPSGQPGTPDQAVAHQRSTAWFTSRAWKRATWFDGSSASS